MLNPVKNSEDNQPDELSQENELSPEDELKNPRQENEHLKEN